MFKLLRLDAQCLSTASTVDQAAAMQETTSRLLIGKAAMWAGSDEDREFQQREKERARAEYEATWGPPPAVS